MFFTYLMCATSCKKEKGCNFYILRTNNAFIAFAQVDGYIGVKLCCVGQMA